MKQIQRKKSKFDACKEFTKFVCISPIRYGYLVGKLVVKVYFNVTLLQLMC